MHPLYDCKAVRKNVHHVNISPKAMLVLNDCWLLTASTTSDAKEISKSKSSVPSCHLNDCSTNRNGMHMPWWLICRVTVIESNYLTQNKHFIME